MQAPYIFDSSESSSNNNLTRFAGSALIATRQGLLVVVTNCTHDDLLLSVAVKLHFLRVPGSQQTLGPCCIKLELRAHKIHVKQNFKPRNIHSR